ncbi:hypothetical protein LZ554_008559 [Drepanopeziza brunnea f. sp. 'monogermtubi']|nr:hypothetical protein LZ554_008559 [Drepanopeziza brunnea f. sp. 'monogermtubi']
MEPFPKRQRLYAPARPEPSRTFEDHDAYYDELGDDILEDEDYYSEEEPGQVEQYNPDAELQQKRAQLDHKLKSTFESIFEKYERDFDGVGDEIDLETGEIVINNGHLLQMMDEQDAGDLGVSPRALTGYSEDSGGPPSGSLDETDMMDMDDEEDEDEDEEAEEEEYEEESEEVEEDGMMEDDLILRGFVQANRFQQVSPGLGISDAPITLPKGRRRETTSRLAPKNKLPSRDDILTQFGPQLGPQIVEYVSQQHVQKESHAEPAWRAPELPKKSSVARNIEPAWRFPMIPSTGPPKQVEPAWRVPDLPSAAPISRKPAQNPAMIASGEEQSQRPEASASIWALARPPARKRLDGLDSNALSKGESAAQKQSYRTRISDPVIHPRTFERAQQAQKARSDSPRKKRNAFTAEEDDMMLKWVSKSRRLGLGLRWQEFASKHPQHSANSWSGRYAKQYTYLSTNEFEETEASELSTEEIGYQPPPSFNGQKPGYDFAPAPRERPVRVRKPAQTDPRILSWNEAVNSIENLDPILHAGIMEDARNGNQRLPQFSSSTRREPRLMQAERQSTVSVQLQGNTPPGDQQNVSLDNVLTSSSLAVELTPEQEDALIPGAPCPHKDCRLYPSILYKLQRRENEDLSEMCLHLFRVHHTTPFPCEEVNCTRKGEQGYFIQLDLVRHVRLAHKTISALQRLRGRVDSDLLEQQVALANDSLSKSDLPPGIPIDKPRYSDFTSLQQRPARNPSSSQPLSGYDPDRTLTPRGIVATSTFTPQTSVSSLKVHRPSAESTALQDVSNAHDRVIMDSQMGSSSQLAASSQSEMEPKTPRRVSDESLPRPLREIPSRRSLNFKAATENIHPSPQTATGSSIELPNPADGSRSTSSGNFRGRLVHDLTHSSPRSSPPMIEAPPNASMYSSKKGSSQDPAESSSGAIASSSKPPLKKAPNPTVLTLTRNVVDSTYDFSDEETAGEHAVAPVMTSSVATALPKNHAKVLTEPLIVRASVGTKPVVDNHIDKPTHATSTPIIAIHAASNPKSKPKASKNFTAKPTLAITTAKKPAKSIWAMPGRKSVANKPQATPAAKTTRPRAHSEGIDELSMGVDDYVLLSSGSTANPLPVPQLGIKHEANTDSPAMNSVPAAKKRKFDTFRKDVSDEQIAADAPVQPTQAAGIQVMPDAAQPSIKTEDEPPLPAARLILPKRRGRPPKQKPEFAAGTSSSQIRSPLTGLSIPIRTSTPLLDLTPARNRRANAERMREIEDSEAEASSPESPLPRPKRTSSGQAQMGNLKPDAQRLWNADSLRAEGVAVLVKTPGGTMRKCGVDRFECGRSFCFRCSGGGSRKVVAA